MTVQYGAIEVQPATRQVLIGGRPAALGARAFDLLLALVERRERLVAKHELLDIVWPDVVVEEGNLHVQISALRKLLGPSAISTIPGRGYRFVAPLRRTTSPPADRSVGGQQVERLAPAEGRKAFAATVTEAAPLPPGNLAAHLEPLVGRESELHTLLAQIEAHRLVTIVGASGMGKTTLARAAAQALRGRWRDGAWPVELAPVSEPAQLVPAVARALRISLPVGVDEGSALDHLVGVLGPMALLLVLDNCEHLIDAASAVAERISTGAPGVHLLATSQELLNISGEALFKLNPLTLPAVGMAPADATQCGAIRLFVERARADDARFALSPDNAHAVADICRRLDGLPLAIELAAARLRLLGVQGLRDKLGECFRVLTGGARTAMRRHQTLHAAIDWSHALLSGPEQVVFRRLGVFVGGFALELALALAQNDAQGRHLDPPLDEWAVLDALSALVDKSLVIADASEPPRYRLLETTRAFALEKLAAARETDAWVERHARAVCAFFERTEEARAGEEATLSHAAFVQRLAPELDNARAALDWAAGGAGELNLAIGLAGATAAVCADLGLSLEALGRMAGLQGRLDDSVHPQRTARFWLGVSELGGVGRLPHAEILEAAHRAQRIYRTTGARVRLYHATAQTVRCLVQAGESRSAEAMLAEPLRLADSAWPAWLRADCLALQGYNYQGQQRFEESLAMNLKRQALLLREPGERRGLILCEADLCLDLNMLHRYEETIALARAVIARERGEHSAGMVYVWMRLLRAQIFLGRIDDAWLTMGQALPGWRRDGAVFIASALLAALLAERGHFADAARVGAAAITYQRRANMERYPAYQRANARWQELLAAQPCQPDDIARWQREGEALDEAAIAAICLRSDEGHAGAA